MRDCHLWPPTQAPSRGGAFWEHLCLVRFWFSSPRGAPQEQDGIWIHLPLWLPCEAFQFFSCKEAWKPLPLHGLLEAERHQSEEPAPPASYSELVWTSTVGSLVHHGGSTTGHYEHPMMPLSACSARATFQYSVNVVLRHLLRGYACHHMLG